MSNLAARRALYSSLTKHRPETTLDERLRWAESLKREFLDALHNTPISTLARHLAIRARRC